MYVTSSSSCVFRYFIQLEEKIIFYKIRKISIFYILFLCMSIMNANITYSNDFLDSNMNHLVTHIYKERLRFCDFLKFIYPFIHLFKRWTS